MSITAKVLDLGVPVVTAFHVARVVLLLTCTAPLFRWLRHGAHRGTINSVAAQWPDRSA